MKPQRKRPLTLRGLTLIATLLALPLTASAEAPKTPHGGRAAAIVVEAVVTNIDPDTRLVTLRGPRGDEFTLAAPEGVVNLDNVSVGDKLVATYLEAIEGELREPTEEELAEPWVVLEDAGIGETEDGRRMVGGARQIRAVCTIEGMNRILGTVTLEDSRGNLHVIGSVEPSKMEGVTLGQTVVVVYEEALALSLEKAGQ